MTSAICIGCRIRPFVTAILLAVALPSSEALAQFDSGPPVPPAPVGPPTQRSLAPVPSSRGDRGPPTGPKLQALPPASAPVQSQTVPATPSGLVGLAVSARFGRELPQVTGGLHWRIYPSKPDQNGAFRLIKEDRTAAPVFTLAPGSYIVSVGLGLASATKAVQLRSETVREVFEIPAGGMRIEGRVGDARIPPGQISFDVFKGSQFEPGDKRPIVQSAVTGDVILLPAGTYHIVSKYGDANAVVRSDIRVQTGKLADATVTHRAAIITLKLVNERGGEALANTQWSVLTPGGDVIKESIGAFPRVILADGEYRAIARNENKTYQREFRVITGVDGEIEVLSRSQ